MRTLGRVSAIGISVLALVGEITRLSRFDFTVGGFLFGWESQQFASRLAYPITVIFGVLIIASGILSAFLHGSSKGKLLKVVSGLAIAIFLLRPFVWIIFYRVEYGGASYEDIGAEIRAWWFNYPMSFGATKVASTFSGIVLFLLLIANLISALVSRPMNNQKTYASPQNFQQPYPQQPVYQQPQYFQPPQAPVQDSMTSQLAELERMFESGTLTKTEFTAAKKRILGS